MSGIACFPSQVKPEDLDKALTPERVAGIWKYARDNYINKGESFEATIKGVSKDIGLPEHWVARAFTKPKALRNVTDQMFRQMSLRREAVRQAREYVAAVDTPGYKKFASAVWNLPRSILTAGHYAVFPVTHAGDLAFRPTAWKAYFKGVIDSYKFINRATHEAAMQDLVRDPNYTIARRGGLVNNPEAEPQGILTGHGLTEKLAEKFPALKSISGASRRGFDALKITRQALFNREWKKIPQTDRNIETSKALSEMINHATGAHTGQIPLGKLQFAPQLNAARWSKALVDPAKTVLTFLDWKDATPAAKHVALARVRNAAEFAAVYTGMLAVNQGLNLAFGSKDKVNFTDPTKSDWLQFKVNGHIVGIGSGVREVYALLGKIVAIGGQTKKQRGGDTATVTEAKVIGRYASQKLSPTLGAILEASLREDKLTGRPLPWSNEKSTASNPRMGYGEYMATHYSPIPISGGAREAFNAMREEGMSAPDTMAILKGAAQVPFEAAGLKYYPYEQQKPKRR